MLLPTRIPCLAQCSRANGGRQQRDRHRKPVQILDDREQAGRQHESGAPAPCGFGPDPVEAGRSAGENGKEKRQREAEAVSVEQGIRKRDEQGGSAELSRQSPELRSRGGPVSVVFGRSGRHGCRSRLGSPSAAATGRTGKARIAAQAVGIRLSSHQPSLASRRGSRDEKGLGAMMSAMRNRCARHLQRVRSVSAELQDSRAAFVQIRAIETLSDR